MNNYESFHDGVHRYLREAKSEIDKYFDKKVKEFEDKTTPKAYVPYVDPYPEEAYRGLFKPMNRLIFNSTDATHILFNRKLSEYRAAWKLKDRVFMDSEHTLPVSEGWIIECNRFEDYPQLTDTHSERATSQKLSHKEYWELYLKDKPAITPEIKTGWFSSWNGK